MKFDMTSIDGSVAGSLELSDAVFGLEPRTDLIARMVRWQLAKRQAGTHKTLGRAEIHRTGKKMYKQKGTGGARHGSARVPQFRGGGRAMGPVVRSHAPSAPGSWPPRASSRPVWPAGSTSPLSASTITGSPWLTRSRRPASPPDGRSPIQQPIHIQRTIPQNGQWYFPRSSAPSRLVSRRRRKARTSSPSFVRGSTPFLTKPPLLPRR